MTPATPEHRLFDLLATEAVTIGRKLTKTEWLVVTATFLAKEYPAAKKAKKKPVSQMTDEEWLVHLEHEPSLAGIDIRRELGKAQFWCNENNRKCNRRFFVNWLNNPRVPRDLSVNGAGQTSRPRVSSDINSEPAGWHPIAVKLFNQFAADNMKTGGWKTIDPYYRKAIVKEML